MQEFNTANRCPICGGDATSKYHRRRCEDCGYSWTEQPPSAPMAESRKVDLISAPGDP